MKTAKHCRCYSNSRWIKPSFPLWTKCYWKRRTNSLFKQLKLVLLISVSCFEWLTGFDKAVLSSDASIRSLSTSEHGCDISIYPCEECIFVSIPFPLNNHSKWQTKRSISCSLNLLLLYPGTDDRKDNLKPWRYWVRERFHNHKRCGEFHNLVWKLRLGDHELYFRWATFTCV